MFNLEAAIWEWRRQMMSSGVNSLEILDEVEAHLRDHIQVQLACGASLEAAFEAALANLGDVSALAKEFAKNNRHRTLSRRFIRAACLVTALCVLLINTWTLMIYELSFRRRLAGMLAVALVASYLALLPRWLGSWAQSWYRVEMIVKAVANLLWLWPLLALLAAVGVIHLQSGIVPLVLAWCVYAGMALTVVGFGLIGRLGRDPGANPDTPLQSKPGPVVPPSTGGDETVDPIMQQCLSVARDEAWRLGHSYIGTEHLLLALSKLTSGPLANVLRKTGLSGEVVRRQVETLISPAAGQLSEPPETPFTPRARKAVRLAAREAKRMRHSLIGAEHLFLGLLSEGSGVGALALRKLGVRIENARREIRGELGAGSIR